MTRRDVRRAALVAFWGACLAGAGSSLASGCSGWDPRAPFERNAPEVDEAIQDLDAGQLEPAEQRLEKYLNAGHCSADGGLGVPGTVKQRADGTFDLGLTLFSLGERYGLRFGDEELADGGAAEEQQLAAKRSVEIDCALLIVRAIAGDRNLSPELRARAHYLAGNLEFLRKKYEDAVKEYDQALAIVPGLLAEAGGDGIGRDAAWNRAIALRRIEDKKDAAPDSPDGEDGADGSDAADGNDGNDGSDGADGADGSDGNDGGNDAGDGGDSGKDAGDDGGDKADAGQDAGQDAGPQDKDAGQQPDKKPEKAKPDQDRRMLDQLEEKPTYQEQEAKQRAHRRGRTNMVDK